MDDEAWNAGFVRSLGMLLSGNAIEEVDERGEPITGDTLLVLLNAPQRQGAVHAAAARRATSSGSASSTRSIRTGADRTFKAGGRYPLQGRSVAVFKIIAAAARTAARRPTSRACGRAGAGAASESDDSRSRESAVGESAVTWTSAVARQPAAVRRQSPLSRSTPELPSTRSRRAWSSSTCGPRSTADASRSSAPSGESVEVTATSSPTDTMSSRRCCAIVTM